MTEIEFEQLVQEIRPELVRIAARRCGRDFAEDAVQMAVANQWSAHAWESLPCAVVKARLRHESKLRGGDEFKKITRFRSAQKNFGVLSNSGHKRTTRKANSDGEGY